MTILLIADHDNARLAEQTARTLTAALGIGPDVHLLIAGRDARPAAQAAAGLLGVSKVLLAESDSLAHRLAEPLAELIVSLADAYDTIIAPATSMGKAVLPRVAALLDVMQISEIVEVVAPNTFKRPTYAGNAIQTVRSAEARKVITVRTAAFAPAAEGGSAAIQAIETRAAPALSRFVENRLSATGRPELGAAKVVVAGGRALGSKEQFQALLLPIADALGAAVGASRAAVDAGYAPNDWQVGQTGKVVAPDLYLAIGISGAIQHLAGMKESRVIVAINSDPDAPIFQIADYGLVADLFAALPELHAALKARG